MTPIVAVSWVDHVFVAVLLLVLPLYARHNFRRLKSRLDEGDRGELVRTYRGTVLRQAVVGATLLTLWLRQGRDLSALGLGQPSGTGFLVGVLITTLLLTYAGLQVVAVSRSSSMREHVRERLVATGLSSLIPLTKKEYRIFAAVAVSAGVWEELIFRGFLIAYCAHFVGVPAGVLMAAAAFGFGHLYQGVGGVLKTGFVGLMVALLFLLTGSLWLSMLLHTAVDLHAGTLGYVSRPDAKAEGDTRS